MKLLPSQYQDLIEALDEVDIAHEQLFLVKKKGRICVHIEGVNATFEFFKRKSVSLSDETKEWRQSEHYELKVSDKEAVVADWKEVVSHFKS